MLTPFVDKTPPLPRNFVERPEELEGLRRAVIAPPDRRGVALTALEGMGGVGKTLLAQALCRDQAVQQAYPDGIVWVTVGRERGQGLKDRVNELRSALGDHPHSGESERACLSRYRTILRDNATLIVLDDIWRAGDLKPFLAKSARSGVLFTTRDSSIAASVGAREHRVDVLSPEQARQVLSRYCGMLAEELPQEAESVIEQAGSLPLALAMVGAMLRGKLLDCWANVLKLLREADLSKIQAQFPNYPQTGLLKCIELSLAGLDEAERKRYFRLAVLLDDMAAAPTIQQTLWNAGPEDALATAERLVELSLAQREGAGLRLHDLQLDYVRAQYPDRAALALIHGAVRLSANVLAGDPGQFASQIVGRLLPHAGASAIAEFAVILSAGTPTPWLRPVQPALDSPGTSLLRALEGHSGGVMGVALTPDGRRAVSASYDNTLKVWDLESGRELRTLLGHAGEGVAVSPDGRRAVSASYDKTLKVWDLESGRELRTLHGHSDGVNGVAVSPDGRRLVSASYDKTLKVWDLESGWELHTLRGHLGGVNGVAVSPDGRRLVSASSDKTLKVWDLESGWELRSLGGHSGGVNGVAVSPDGRRAVSASSDKTLKVWDLESGQELCTLQGHSGWVMGVAVSPDGQRALSASYDETLKVWDLESGRELRTLQGHSGWVNGVAVSPDGRRAVSASSDKTLKLWDMESGWDLRTPEGHSGVIMGVAVSPDGRRALSASHDKTLKVWDLESGRKLCTLEGHSGVVMGVAVSPDGRCALSASHDKTLKVWDMESGQELRTLKGHSAGVNGVAVSPDGRRAVSASDDKTLKVWDLESGRELRTLEGHSDWVRGVAVSPDGRRAVSASDDKTLKMWDLESGRELRTLEGHSAGVMGVALSPDGRRAVSASDDQALKVWDLETAAVVASYTCDASACCCAFASVSGIVAGDALGRMHQLELVERK